MATASGGKDPPDLNLSKSTTRTPPWAGAGNSSESNAMRTFSQIMEQEQANRNILDINIYKIKTNEEKPPKNLSFDDLGDLIFDVLKISPNDCLSFDFTTGRYDTRQLKLKPQINTSEFITPIDQLIIFKDHEVHVRQQRKNVTRVQFRNVPLNVPNEEILNLCFCYGTVVNNFVQSEKMTNTRNKGMTGSTRFVEMILNPGASFQNFYWMEGPLAGDMGRRITVLHSGQTPQCNHCLRTYADGCPAQGNGKLCSELNTPRAKMAIYMQGLREKVGYASLKIKYYEYQAKNFPSISGNNQENVGYSNIEDCDNDEECEILPMNPIQEKDKKIAELEQKLSESSADFDNLRETLTKTKAELSCVKKNSLVLNKKINFTNKVTEDYGWICFLFICVGAGTCSVINSHPG